MTMIEEDTKPNNKNSWHAIDNERDGSTKYFEREIASYGRLFGLLLFYHMQSICLSIRIQIYILRHHVYVHSNTTNFGS